MPFQIATSDLIRILDPAAASTRACFSDGKKPWTAGYALKANASAAARLLGVNMPGRQSSLVATIVGKGQSAGATPKTYDTQATDVALPTTADITDAINYANAIAVLYADASLTSGTLLTRLATGAANPAFGNFWRIDDANTISVATTYAAGPLFSDMPLGSVLRIYVPPASEIATLWNPAAVGDTVIFARDFMIAGHTAETGKVVLNRVCT